MSETIKYCKQCGNKMYLAPRREYPFYSEDTGLSLMDFICKNETCKIGCANTGGHFYPKAFLVVRKCTRCGNQDVYY